MNEISIAVGGRIRLYRQMKKLTLMTLAEKIHKSKATLSKYETGDIVVDVETLFDIARALEIKPQQLLDSFLQTEEEQEIRPDGFFPQRRICVYFYDGRVKRIVRNLLETGHDGVGRTATFYNDIPSFDRPEACRNLYFGTVEYFDTVTNFSFTSQSNRIERLTMCAANPFDRGGQVLGMLSGISRYPMLPVSIKCILSPGELKEDEELMRKLVLSQKDIKLIRTLNMFAVEQLG
ncbi:MAG: helix-turn-helix transcriptional regulator [Clostridia bacterium]|nr:helix-turn-helix transcriptional regulator [Clostridia bacterium]